MGGRRPWSAPATPGPPWRARCCGCTASRGSPAGHRHPDPGARARPRPCCSTPEPTPSAPPPGWCSSPAWVRCWPASATASPSRRVGLLSIGEEEAKGTPLVKETHALLVGGGPGSVGTFIGNVEGRDLMTDRVDVVVTDGFTGNVMLKTTEGALRFAVNKVLETPGPTEETKEAARVLLPALSPLAEELDPDTHGGACCSGSMVSASSATGRRRPGRSSTPSGSGRRRAVRVWSPSCGRPRRGVSRPAAGRLVPRPGRSAAGAAGLRSSRPMSVEVHGAR